MSDQIQDVQNNNSVADTASDEILKLKERIAELENNWKRALADYKNLEKRMVEERTNFVDFANATIILRVLPVVDNLEMLEAHINDMGLKLTIKEFKQILQDENVKETDCTGKSFDAATMEAVELGNGEKDTVIEVIRKGYLFKDKLLRPARVKVGR